MFNKNIYIYIIIKIIVDISCTHFKRSISNKNYENCGVVIIKIIILVITQRNGL